MLLSALRLLDDGDLHKHFTKSARYLRHVPTMKYHIRVGSISLFSDDTLDLWNQFHAYVRSDTSMECVNANRTTEERTAVDLKEQEIAWERNRLKKGEDN